MLRWNFFNRPLILIPLMLVALGTFLWLKYDGFRKTHIMRGDKVEDLTDIFDEIKFDNNQARDALRADLRGLSHPGRLRSCQ